MKEIRFGLIGCGQIARCNHVPGVAKLGSLGRIVAVCDRTKPKAEAFVKELSLEAKVCADAKALLKEDIDAVIIATPNSLHYPQAMAAMRAGKHVLVEKPMATDVHEADRMIAYSRRKKLVLQVNQSLRFHKLYAEFGKRIADGAIGDPIHIRCIRTSTASPDVAWSKGSTWFVKKKYGGSLVTDIAVHMADVMQWAFGPVRKISAINRNRDHEVPDNVSALFDFGNGATGVLELSWTFPASENDLTAWGTLGRIRLVGEDLEITPKDSAKKTVCVSGKKMKDIPDSHRSFVDRIAAGNDQAWREGRSALALCMAINESSRSGRRIVPKNYKKD